MSLECAGELLYLGTANCSVPSLRLNIDQVKTKSIFLDDPIDPAIAAPSDCLAGVAERTAIAHSNKQFNDEPLKERR